MGSATLSRPNRQRNAVRTSAAHVRGPLLQSGFHLSRSEFHRRYQQLPEDLKAELIEGVVLMGSPVSRIHAEATRIISGWLFTYTTATPGVLGLDNGTVLLDRENEVQPDALLLLEASRGGQTRFSREGYVDGPPELVVEVALTSVAHDLHEKLRAYQRNRVLEYLVWQLQEGRIDWFCGADGKYVPLGSATGGLFRSRVFPGLWLDSAALVSHDLKQLVRSLQKGLRSPEHREFVKKASKR